MFVASEQEVAAGDLGPDEVLAALDDAMRLRSLLELHVWTLAARADALGAAVAEGAASTTAWIASRCGTSRAEAAGIVEAGRRMRDLPVTRQSVEEGRLSATKARTVTRLLRDDTVQPFVDDEATYVERFEPMPAEDVACVMRYYDELNRPDDDEPDTHDEVHLAQTFGGRYHGHIALHAEGGAIVARALDDLLDESYRNDPDHARWPLARRRAMALVEMARRAQGHAGRPDITLTIPHDRLHAPADTPPTADDILAAAGRGATGTRIHHTDLRREAIERLCCDATITGMVLDGTVPIDLGRSVRTATPHQRRALAERDRHCTFPGCDRPPKWCQAHHLVFWTEGGSTDLDQMALVCHHHHAVHDRGFSVHRRPDGHLEWRHPDGTPVTTPGTPVSHG